VTRVEAEARFKEIRDHIGMANKILVVGGGPIGVELVGEIKAGHKGKDVTRVHRGVGRQRSLAGRTDDLVQHIQGTLFND
jgi:pyruvate/2-oxoglutarate dehydrogenase complex dihydrolipoamide dehydrogenase (E3) component